MEGLNVTVSAGLGPGSKAKSKSKGEGIEILNKAKLRLKAGRRYALVGRNGTGKSSEYATPDDQSALQRLCG